MSDRNGLNELAGIANYFVGNRSKSLLTGVHVVILTGTLVPTNMKAKKQEI
jgi:hypothetical protein